MKIRNLSILVPALLLLILGSCKDETEKVYMDGTLKIEHSIPAYVSPGDVFTLKASGITAPDGTAVGYYFTNPVTKVSDTTAVYTYTVPDSLGTFSLSCAAYPVESSDKYYISYASVSMTVVSPKSITGVGKYDDDGSAVLYSRYYATTKGGDREWIRSNLSYTVTDASGVETFGRSFADNTRMREVFGAYYTWEEAQTACPDGWHLPSGQEWVALLQEYGTPDDLGPLQDSPSGAGKLMANASFNGTVLWPYYRGVNISDESHFSAIPAGYANAAGEKYEFSGYLSFAAFWTSDEYEGQGVYRYICKEYDKVYAGVADKKAFAASVRCVR